MEEIGGVDGMGKLLQTPEFAALGTLGFALDEGLANPNDAYTVFYGERTPWWLLVRATGPTGLKKQIKEGSLKNLGQLVSQTDTYYTFFSSICWVDMQLLLALLAGDLSGIPGHGSRFIKETAPQKLLRVAERALAFRKQQEDSLGHDQNGSMMQRFFLFKANCFSEFQGANFLSFLSGIGPGIASFEGFLWVLCTVLFGHLFRKFACLLDPTDFFELTCVNSCTQKRQRLQAWNSQEAWRRDHSEPHHVAHGSVQRQWKNLLFECDPHRGRSRFWRPHHT